MNFNLLTQILVRMRGRTVSWSLTVFFLTAFPSVSLAAPGSVSGRVLNEATGNYLEGARVEIQGSGRVAYSQSDGRFRFDSVPEGEHTLVVHYVGLDDAIVTVQVAPGETVRREIGMRSEIYKLAPYVVSSEREGSAMAIMRQKNAPGQEWVLSADHFGSLHTQNLGSFMQRLPGISTAEVEGEISDVYIRGVGGNLNSITLDGVALPSSSVKLSSDRGADINKISADFIAAVELIRAPTADQQAQALGGQINLIMKTPFDQKGRLITFSAGGTYDLTEPNGVRPFATVNFSDVFGANEDLGVMLGASTSEYTNSSSLAQQTWLDPRGGNPLFAGILTLWRKDFAVRRRQNFNFGIYKKLSEQTQIYAKGFYQVYDDTYNSYNYTSVLGGPNIAASTPEMTARNNARFATQRWKRTTDTTTWNLALGGRTDLESVKLEYDVSYFKTNGEEDQNQTDRLVNGVNFTTDRTENPAIPDAIQTGGPDRSSWEDSTVDLFIRTTTNDDEQFNASASLRKEFDIAVPASIKAGFQYSSRKKVFDVEWPRWIYVGPDGVAGSADDNLESQFADPTWNDVIFGKYEVIPFQDPVKILESYNANPGYWQENVFQGFVQGNNRDYTAEEDTLATYIMGDVKLGRLAINSGVRVENTHAEASALEEHVAASTFEERFGTIVTKTGKYQKVLPSVHFKYSITDSVFLRGSYTQTFGRPAFTQLRPLTSVNDDNMVVVANNPDLEPWTSENFEVSLEYYFEPIGVFSVSAYLKEMSNLVFSLSTVIESGPDNGFDGMFVGYDLITRRNGGDARARGIEVNYSQQFTMLPGWLKGFGIYANYTWQETEGNYLDSDDNLVVSELPNYIPRSANAGITYSAYGFSIRAAVNWLDDYLVIRSTIPELSQYRFARTTLDLKAAYAITEHYSLEASIVNLTNEPINDYNGDPSRYRRYLDRGRAVTFGIRGRF